jgi:DNA-binding CsgD family transcriptional regulator
LSACTVVVGHREAIVAEGLAAALARCPDIVPVGSATTPAEVVRLGRKAVAVAVDAEMSEAESVATTLRRCGVRVVFLGSNGSDDESVRVSTGARVAVLAAALNPQAGRPHRSATVLTGREREVLSLVAVGLAGKQVARHLGISPKTVERHKTKIFSKLGVPNAAAAVGFLLSTSGGGAAWNQSTT